MKQYKAPMLYVDTFAADTTIAASSGTGFPKNGNAANNHNCWACDEVFNKVVGENACLGPNTPGC